MFRLQRKTTVACMRRSEREAGKAPLAQYAASLHAKAIARRNAATTSEVIVGADDVDVDGESDEVRLFEPNVPKEHCVLCLAGQRIQTWMLDLDIKS